MNGNNHNYNDNDDDNNPKNGNEYGIVLLVRTNTTHEYRAHHVYINPMKVGFIVFVSDTFTYFDRYSINPINAKLGISFEVFKKYTSQE